jgi:hypothetical protein
MSIVAPEAGRFEEMSTVNGKVDPGDGGSVVLIPGVVVTVIAVSLQPPPPPLFLQLAIAESSKITVRLR